MTNQTTWQTYTGSDEQIAAIWNHYNGFLLNTTDKILTKDNFRDSVSFVGYLKNGVTRFWLIPDDPLREMKIKQACTGQPVFVKVDKDSCGNKINMLCVTTTPDWNIQNAEYSFTEFKEEV